MASSLKLIVLLALAAVVVIVSGQEDNLDLETPTVQSSPTTSNDLILGKREKGDKLVGKYPVKAASKIGRKVIVKKTIEAPKQEITLIKALDRATKKGATVELVTGGVGTDSVTLRFKSQRSNKINFEVFVYAKPSKDDGSDESEEDGDDE